MEEGERKICLAEPTLELMEETLLQVQMKLLEKTEALEALEAEEEKEAMVEEEMEAAEAVIIPLLIVQEQMEVSVEMAVMGAAADAAEEEASPLITTNKQE